MQLQKTLHVLNKLVSQGVIGPYAISGAVAAIRYLEPSVTQDLDILVSFEPKSGLITLDPIFSSLRELGYDNFLHEGIVIEGWPVQFIPVMDKLDSDALKNARDIEIDVPHEPSVRTRILTPEHLIAIALRTGRPKDYTRILEFMDSDCVDMPKLCGILRDHGLTGPWQSFCARVDVANPCLEG